MKKLLNKIGYNGQVLSYVTKRVCGLWFIIIGTVEALGIVFGGTLCVNPIIFIVGYLIGFYLCYGNRKIIFNKLAQGEQSDFQHKSSDWALYILVALCTVLGIFNWISHNDSRTIWLSIFVVVGIHFMFFYFVHGNIVIWLGILCIIYSVIGLVFSYIPFIIIGFIDSITKIAFGVIMIMSKVTNNKKAFYMKLYKN